MHCLLTASSAWGTIFPLNWGRTSVVWLWAVFLHKPPIINSDSFEVTLANLGKWINLMCVSSSLSSRFVCKLFFKHESILSLPPLTHRLFAGCKLSHCPISVLMVLLTLATQFFFLWADSLLFLSYWNLALSDENNCQICAGCHILWNIAQSSIIFDCLGLCYCLWNWQLVYLQRNH